MNIGYCAIGYCEKPKKIMKFKLSIILLALILNLNEARGLGLADWSSYTKNETHFSNSGGITITLGNRQQYQYLKRWYFYEDHIVGIGRKRTEGNYKNEYFVVNEKKSSLRLFENENSWNNYRESNNLNPKIWTRWFMDEWSLMRVIMLFAMILSPVTAGVVLLNFYFYYKVFKTRGKKKKWKILALIVPVFLLTFYLLGEFPQSI